MLIDLNERKPLVRPHLAANMSRRLRWLTGGSLAAAAMYLGAFPNLAEAQVTAPGGQVLANITYDNTQANFQANVTDGAEVLDVVTILDTQVIVDWNTFSAGVSGTDVTFLPAGNNLRFTSNGLDYTVLNRVLTPGFDSAIRIDGNVQSQINGATGGTVWFYSPGGIIAGASSVFDVGNLVLTTNEIDTSGGLLRSGGEIRFRGLANSQSAVTVEAGASIGALNNGSYVALVAPRVNQAGTVNVNGSAAYVASEQADLTINNGLFDITIPVGSGTTDTTGIVHSGTTTGAASTSNITDAQAIYAVAVPKNAALTMLIGGDIGYQPAVSASIKNGSIVLSSGYNVASGLNGITPVPVISSTPVNALDATLELAPGSLSSDILTRTAGDISFVLDGTEQIVIEGDLNITSGQSILASHTNRSDGFNSFDISGSFVASAQNNITLDDVRVSAGQIAIEATAGSLLGTGQLVSADDVGITVGQNITADLIDVASQLTSFTAVGGVSEGDFVTPGSITVGSYITGLTSTFRVEAGNTISFGSVTGPDTAVSLLAAQGGTGDVFLGTTTGASGIILQGDNVGFTNLNATQNIASAITILANSGDVSGGDATSTNLMDIEAIGGSVNVGNLTTTSFGAINLDATTDIIVDTISLNSSTLRATAGGDFDFNDISAFAASINATNVLGDTLTILGVTGGAPNSAAFNTTGNVTFTSATIADALNVTTGGTFSATTLDLGSGAAVTAGAFDVTTLDSLQAVNITATVGDLDIDTLTTTSFSRLESQNGDVNLGTANVNFGFNVTANNGSINFTDITAASIGLIGGDITGNDLVATGTSIGIDSTGTLTTGNISADDNIDIDAVIANVGNVTNTGTAPRLIRIEADDITTGALDSTLIITLTAANGSVLTDAITSVGSASLSATNGNITTLGVDSLRFFATADGNISVGNVAATGDGVSDLGLNAGGTLNFGSILAGRIIDLDGTVITGGNITSTGGQIGVDGTAVTLGDVSGPFTIAINATAGNVTTGALASTSGTIVTASGVAAIESITSAINDARITGGSVNVATVDVRNLTINATAGDIDTTGIYDASGFLRLNATSGNIDATGAFTVGGAVDLDASGNIDFGSITAATTFNADSTAGDITFVTANTNNGLIAIDAAGDITGNSANASLGGNDGGSDALTLTAGENITLTGTASTLDNFNATANGLVNISTLNVTDSISLTGTSVTFNDATAGAGLALNATAGEINGTGTITVGGLANFDATGDINFGSITAGTGFDVDSTAGNIAFVTANTNTGNVDITADGNIVGNSTATGLNGDDGGPDGLTLTAGGNIALTGTISALDNIIITATGDLNLATLTTPDNVTLAGNAIAFTDVNAGDIINLNATGNVNFNTASAATNIDIDSTGGGIMLGTVDVNDGSITIDVTGDIIGGSISSSANGNDGGGDNIDLNAGGNIAFTGTLSALDNINLTAVGTLNVATINATDSINLSGTSVTLSNGTAGDDIVANATAGAANINAINAGGGIDLTGTTVTLNNGIAGSDLAINATTGDIIATGTYTVGRDLTLNAIAGNINAIGMIDVGRNVDLDASGNIAFGSLRAGTFFDADAGGAINFTSATSADNINMFATGAINGGDLTATDDITVTAGTNLDLDVLDAGANLTLNADNLSVLTINALGGVTATATTGNVNVGTTAAGTDVIFTGNNIFYETISGRAVTLNAIAGQVLGSNTGAINALTNVAIDATTSITVGDVLTNDGTMLINAGTTLTAGALNIATGGLASNERMELDSGGDMLLGAVRAQDTLTITSGGGLTAASLSGVGIAASATGTVDIGDANIFNGVANGDNIIISGTSINLDSADAPTATGAAITLDATAGAITLGTINAEQNLTVTATADISFDTLTGLGVFLDSGGNVLGTSASADRAIISGTPRAVQITAIGDVAVTNLSAVNDVEITAASFDTDSIVTGAGIGGVASDVRVNVTGNATIDSAIVQGIMDVDAATINVGTADMVGTLDLNATTGGLIIGSIITDQNVIVNAIGDVLLGSSTKRGTDTLGNETMSFTSDGGDVIVTGTIDSHDAINLTADGAVAAQQLIAFDDVNATAGTAANIAGVTTTSTGTATLTAQSITLGASTLDGGLTANATAGDVNLTGDVTGTGLIDLDASANISFASLTTGGQVNVNAVGGNIVGGSSLKTGTDSLGNESMSFAAGGALTLSGTIDTHDSITLNGGGLVTANNLMAFDNVTITAGTAGTADITNITTTATGNASLTAGSITVGGASLDGNFTANATAGSLNLTGAITSRGADSLSAISDIMFMSITGDGNKVFNAGGNISGTDIIANGADGGADNVIVNAGGNFVTTGMVSALDGINITSTGGAITANFLQATDALTVNASGAVNVTQAATLTNDAASFAGASVLLDSGDFAGSLTLNATAGDVAGTGTIGVAGAIDIDATVNIGFGALTANTGAFNLDAGGDINFTSATSTNTINMTAVGSINGGDLNATNALNLNGGNIAIGNAIASSINFASAADILFDTIISPNAVSLTALSGTIGKTATGAGDITSGASITLNAAATDIGTLDAVTSVAVTTTGAAAVDSAISGTTTDITGAEITLNNGTIGTDLTLNVTAGDLDGSGSITVGGAIDFDATGDVGFGSLSAQNGVFDVDAGGDINFASATSTNTINMTSVGGINGGDLNATNALNLNGGNIAIGDVVADSLGLTSATNILFNSITSPNAVTLTAANGLIGKNTGSGDISSAGNITLTSQSVDVGNLISGGSILADVTMADATFTLLDAVNSVDIKAKGALEILELNTGGITSILASNSTLGAGVIGGNLLINNTGNANFAFDGIEQLTIAGTTNISGQNILITHTNNNTSTVSIDSANNFTVIATGDFDASSGSIINTGNEMFIVTDGSISANDLRAVPVISLTAGQNVLLNNATASGPQGVSNFSGIIIDAGFNNFSGANFYDPSSNATLTGTITSYSNVIANSGGNIVVQTGAGIQANDGVRFSTGDDIIIQTGSSVLAGVNPSSTPDLSDPFIGSANLILNAGALSGSLLSTPLTPISSIVIAGNVGATDFAVVMTAQAIDGLGGTIAASSIQVDVNNAPNSGATQSDDNGLLSTNCLQGNICLGFINADNRIEIGQNEEAIQAIIESGDVSARRIRISTRRDVVLGTDGVATTLNASDDLLLRSAQGDVDLRDATIGSDLVQIGAVNGSLLGSSAISSANDIGIDVGGSISAASINTGGELTTIANIGGAKEGSYSVAGDMNVGTLTVGVGDVNYDAGGDFTFGSIIIPNSDITLVSGGTTTIDNTNSAQNINITASDIFLGSADADNITIAANNAITTNTLISGRDIDLIAGGVITSGDLSAVNALDLDGNLIAVGNATAGNINFSSATDILFDGIASTDTTNLTAVNGTIGTNTSNGNIDSGANVDLTAQTINVGNVTSGGSVAAGATAGVADFRTINAATDIAVTAAGTPTIANAISGGNTTIMGQSVTLTNGNIGGNLILNATTGDLDANGAITVGGTIYFDAAGDISLGDLSAQGGDFAADAGGRIDFTNAEASQSILFNAGSGVTGVNMTSGRSIDVDTGAGNFTADQLNAGQAIDLRSNSDIQFSDAAADANIGVTAIGGDIQANTINSGTNVRVRALNGFVAADSVTAQQTGQGSVRIDAENGIDINNVTGNDVDLFADNAAIAVRTNADVANDIQAFGQDVLLRSIGDLNARAEATAGNVDISTAGNLNVRGADATGNITLTSTGGSTSISQTFTRPSSIGAVPVTTGAVTGQAVTTSGGNISITAATDAIVMDTTTAASILSITAGELIDIQAVASGVNVDVSGADINIASTGQLGRSDLTEDLTITNDGSNQFVLGGTGTTGAFNLDADEFTRLNSGDNVTLSALGTATGNDMLVQDLNTLVASGTGGTSDGNIGANGGLFLQAQNDIRIDGAVTLSNAGNTNLLSIDAGNNIRLNALGGNVRSEDASGNVAGAIQLAAATVIATTDALADAAFGSVADADTGLANNDGIVRDEGLFQADSLTFNVDNGLFIQNTAAGTDFDDRRGFQTNNLTINGPSTGNIGIVVNGVVNGNIGVAAIGVTNIGVGFDPASTVNGCIIANPASCVPTSTVTPTPIPTPSLIPAPDPEISDPIQDVIDKEVEPSELIIASDPLENTLIQINETQDYTDDPLIDDPVTGIGNDDLWIKEECADSAGDNCGEGAASKTEEKELEPAE